jgi:hypothetical protein
MNAGTSTTSGDAVSYDCLLDEIDVAHHCKVSLSSVRKWRLFNRGPKFLKIGTSVRYRPEDLTAFLDSRPTGGGSGQAR